MEASLEGLGVPRTTARGWLEPTRPVEMLDQDAGELRAEVLRLRRRVEKLRGLLRFVLMLRYRSPRITISGEETPNDSSVAP